MVLREKIIKNIIDRTVKTRRIFLQATLSPRQEQGRVLEKIIKKNKNTIFGKDFGFSKINSVEDFQRQVPVADYDFIRGYIEKEKRGESGQLTASSIEMFVLTSGTTSSEKFIPVTSDYLKSYEESMWTWISSLLRDHPRIIGKILTVVSPKIEKYTEAGIPCGNFSGLCHEDQSSIVKHLYVSKCPMFEISDASAKYYTLARASVENNLTHINTPNPLTILKICKIIEENSEKIIKDIYNGEISADIDSKLIKKIKIKPNKKRARKLEKLLDEGKFRPEFFWPDLEVIGCWKAGTQHLFLQQFPRYFGDVPVRDIGFLASEARVTIPLSDEGSSGPLDINHNFFEFIPEQEFENKNPEVLTAEQVKENEKYYLVLTTQAGLYRYNINDLVEIDGFYNNTPQVKFLSKGKHISSIIGEKITEHQVVNAYRRIRTSQPDKFVLFPSVNGSPDKINYVFTSPFEVSDEFLDRFDKELQKSNVEYASKRKTNRLGTIIYERISQEDFDKMTQDGGRAQFKFKYLHTKLRTKEQISK
jgi:hypothetical protein